MIGKLFCFISLHNWRYYFKEKPCVNSYGDVMKHSFLHRECKSCGKVQFRDMIADSCKNLWEKLDSWNNE